MSWRWKCPPLFCFVLLSKWRGNVWNSINREEPKKANKEPRIPHRTPRFLAIFSRTRLMCTCDRDLSSALSFFGRVLCLHLGSWRSGNTTQQNTELWTSLLKSKVMSASPFIELKGAPENIISSIKFSPLYHHLLVGSWDNCVSLYNTSPEAVGSPDSTSPLLTKLSTDSPVTDVCWGFGGRKAYLSTAQGDVREVDLENSRATATVGQPHDLGIQSLISLGSTSTMISGSWDKSLHYLDTRTGKQVQDVALPGKVFAMDSTSDGMTVVVAMSNRSVHIYDVRNPQEPMQVRESGLKYQTRNLKCMPNGQGYAQSSIEGRVAIEYFDPSSISQAKKYAFKCHRLSSSDMDLVSPVNALTFHNKYGTLFTGGSDNHVCVWDHQSKKRLRQYSSLEQSVVSLDFDAKGTNMLAVATSDDSFKTMATTDVDVMPLPSKLYIRVLADGEGAPKVKS